MTRISKTNRFFLGLATVVLYVVTVFLIYTGSMPKQYSLQVGDTSPYDITAPRSIADTVRTEKRAMEARSQVPDVLMRADRLADAVKSRTAGFLETIQNRRDILYVVQLPAPLPTGNEPTTTTAPTRRTPTSEERRLAISALISQLDQSFGILLPVTDAQLFIEMDETRFVSLKNHIQSIADAIMQKSVDTSSLMLEITGQVDALRATMTYYPEDADLVSRQLTLLLQPNVEHNNEATTNARKAAYDRVMNNPIMINRGTRIVTQGDVITPDIYQLLVALDLTDAGGFDYLTFGGLALMILMLVLVLAVYLNRHADMQSLGHRAIYLLMVTLLIPLLVSVYTARGMPLSPPVYFAAVVLAAYFGFRLAMVSSMMLIIAILPMTGFDPAFPFIAGVGCLIAALFTKGISRQDNYAKIILATAVTNLLMTLAYSLTQKVSLPVATTHMIVTVASGMISVIAAIGIMPLFELLFNAVSPLRLIELSQTGHPLMKRLFVEAPGTSQHSMMVANLSDSAAEAIGANAMIARVGAYYHDIGKLENPLMFTENQDTVNPHDILPPHESAKIITRHPEDGLRLGRRYHLPQPILRIIHEHHGNTVLQYFYRKACDQAEKDNLPAPDPAEYRYDCPVPTSRESAVVMLSDSVEAALKSNGIDNLVDAERVIRSVVKTKNDQSQLVQSGLSFKEVETMITAFLQVYSGHFHERIRYPGDQSDRQSTD